MGGMAKEESGSSNNDSNDFGNSRPKPSNLLNETTSFPASNLNDGANSNLLEKTDLYQKPNNTNTTASGLTNDTQKNKARSKINSSVVYDDGVSDLEPSIVPEIDTAKEMDKKNDQFAKQQLKSQKEKAKIAEQEKKAHYKRLDQQNKAQTLATTENSTKPTANSAPPIAKPIKPQPVDRVSSKAKEDSESLANTIANKSGEMNGLPPIIDTMIKEDPLAGTAVSNDFAYRLEKQDPEAARRYRELVHPIHQKHAPAINKAQAEVDARYQRELDAYNQYKQPHPEVNKLLEDETSILASGKPNDLIHGDSGDDILETGVRFDENGDMEIVDRDQAIASGYLTDEDTFTALRSPQKPSEPLRITKDNQVLDRNGKIINNIIASEDGRAAFVLHPATGVALSDRTGQPLKIDLRGITDTEVSANDIRSTKDTAIFTTDLITRMSQGGDLSVNERKEYLEQAKVVFEKWPDAYKKAEALILRPSTKSKGRYSDTEQMFSDFEELVYAPQNHAKVRHIDAYASRFKSDEEYETYLEDGAVLKERSALLLKKTFLYSEVLQKDQIQTSLKEISSRLQGDLKPEQQKNLAIKVNKLEEKLIHIETELNSTFKGMSPKKIAELRDETLEEFIDVNTAYQSKSGMPYKELDPDRASLEADLGRSDLEEGMDIALTAFSFIPGIGGYKWAAQGVGKAAAIAQKSIGKFAQSRTALKAGQETGQRFMNSHLRQQGIDPTNYNAVLVYVEKHPEIHREASKLAMNAMLTSMAIDEGIEKGAGAITKSPTLEMVIGKIGEEGVKVKKGLIND